MSTYQALSRQHYIITPRPLSQMVGGKDEQPDTLNEQATQQAPKARYTEQRADVARLSGLPVSSLAMRYKDRIYSGVIDAQGKLFIFSMASTGFKMKQLEDLRRGWELYNKIADEEEEVNRRWRRGEAFREQDQINYVLNNDIDKADDPDNPDARHKSYVRMDPRTGKLEYIAARGPLFQKLAPKPAMQKPPWEVTEAEFDDNEGFLPNFAKDEDYDSRWVTSPVYVDHDYNDKDKEGRARMSFRITKKWFDLTPEERHHLLLQKVADNQAHFTHMDVDHNADVSKRRNLYRAVEHALIRGDFGPVKVGTSYLQLETPYWGASDAHDLRAAVYVMLFKNPEELKGKHPELYEIGLKAAKIVGLKLPEYAAEELKRFAKEDKQREKEAAKNREFKASKKDPKRALSWVDKQHEDASAIKLERGNPFNETDNPWEYHGWEVVRKYKPQTVADVRAVLGPFVNDHFEGTPEELRAQGQAFIDVFLDNKLITYVAGTLPSKPKAGEFVAKEALTAISTPLVEGLVFADAASNAYDAKQLPLEAQNRFREQYKLLCAKYGMVDRDTKRSTKGNGLYRIVTGFEKDTTAMTHDYAGVIRVSQKYHERLIAGFKKLSGEDITPLTNDEIFAVSSVAHETIHGHSPKDSSAYIRHGKLIEEVTTEVGARALMMKEWGTRPEFKNNYDLYNQTRWSGSKIYGAYGTWIGDVLGVMGTTMGISERGCLKMLEDASIEMRKAGRVMYDDPDEYVRFFISKLDIEGHFKALGYVGASVPSVAGGKTAYHALDKAVPLFRKNLFRAIVQYAKNPDNEKAIKEA